MCSVEKSAKTLRRFRWSDLQDFAALLSAIGPHGFRHWPESAEDLAAELQSMRLRPGDDIFLLERAGQLCGYALSFPEPDIGRAVGGLGVLPGHAGSAGPLLDAVIAAAHSYGLPSLHTASRHSEADPPSLFTSRGFEQVAESIEMVLTRSAAHALSEEALPDGGRLRTMAPEGEVCLLTEVQNAVFKGHWGFSENSEDELRARLSLPGTGPENVLFAESAEGEVTAYAWTALEWSGGQTSGRVLMTGVMPRHRQSGLGTAVAQAAIKSLLSAGAAEVRLEVMADNEPAIAMYTRMGFLPDGRTTWLSLPLQ